MSKDVFDNLRVASPCPASGENMSGDERVRFCGLCQKNVYNLTKMTKTEATELIRVTGGNLCARGYQRADGTLILGDCPVGLKIVHSLRKMSARVASLLLAFLLPVAALAESAYRLVNPGRETHSEPRLSFRRIEISPYIGMWPPVTTGPVGLPILVPEKTLQLQVLPTNRISAPYLLDKNHEQYDDRARELHDLGAEKDLFIEPLREERLHTPELE